ncbi:hypothetical protein CGH87_22915 [Vibrio parahaemolyticus]|uniref:hypothetical protein n=1 Tax=Vibrio parahaemolyticus TaxID=670 RepID=UPI0011203A03|nr:hypothetical protein [Vibrio parahaemolyticus]EGR3304252.1 hypothetical protein [Vibrio parahaemolyticus]EGR3320477.1 hypothetical protein [Vibrio parahaemolyticus]TOG57597.1 hypothetical protein CGI97_23190 [Vibrio parahaemolyticus]TOG61313.1 hypothetical protein CGI98_22505 [Vibrio parahaemolyticus]TOL91370.1 hypothetical protein CGH87_22915 [Vibrio parahaemolyticus]
MMNSSISGFSVPSDVPLTQRNEVVAEQLTQQSPIIQRAASSVPHSDVRASVKDPLDLIDELLSRYLDQQTVRAKTMADTIETWSNAIAEINRIWGLVMQDNMNHTNPNDNNTRTQLGDGVSGQHLTDIDRIIREELKDDRGIAAITGLDLNASKTHRVSYTDLQSLNATMTAYCDTIQVDIDTEQQKFKNVMTEITSAQEEIRDVRRVIVTLSQGG